MNTKQTVLISAISIAMLSGCPGQHRALIPIDTTHTRHNDQLNGATPGFGYEYHYTGINFSFLHLHDNSYDDPSNYYAISQEISLSKNTDYLIGAGVGTNYKGVAGRRGLLPFILQGVQVYSMRVVTSFPSAELICNDPYDLCADFIQLQYVYKF